MSKNKANGVSLINFSEKNSIDIMRLGMAFAGPVEKDILLDEKLINGVQSFLGKVTQLIESVLSDLANGTQQ